MTIILPYRQRVQERRVNLSLAILLRLFSRRVIVAGYGDSQPIPGVAPEDARQRRIEVRFVLPEK